MSQEEPRRPREGQEPRGPIKYDDVFNVSGGLASKAVAPQDAAMMQSAETAAFGSTQPGGQAERAGLVSRGDAAADQGVTITGTEIPAGRIITESLDGQVVGQYVQVAAEATTQQGAITVGQALEATMQTIGDKPVELSDAAAIREAEMRATGSNILTQGGYAASAQSAAAYNTGMIGDEDKIKLRDVLAGASAALPAKVVTRQDAEAVVNAERRNSPQLTTHPGGVAESMETAATLNENINIK
ncbi:hypothetical protein CUMW_185980 [Citrus unshiu]|uniref:SMP domain-containing protein n=1 Tax=Citrus sinensis TaxID=2711 RepID=A0A067G7H6_CITSI|nr:hypothetical protein CISIN_1g035654mg [Citrus sinensis]GAY58299.1 hypothetical protein CUMW_185980 [Citrus unshiu]